MDGPRSLELVNNLLKTIQFELFWPWVLFLELYFFRLFDQITNWRRGKSYQAGLSYDCNPLVAQFGEYLPGFPLFCRNWAAHKKLVVGPWGILALQVLAAGLSAKFHPHWLARSKTVICWEATFAIFVLFWVEFFWVGGYIGIFIFYSSLLFSSIWKHSVLSDKKSDQFFPQYYPLQSLDQYQA